MVISSLWYTIKYKNNFLKKEKFVSFFMLNNTLKAGEFRT